MRNPCRQRRFLSSQPCRPVRSEVMRDPLARPQTLAEETGPGNGRTRTVRPCSGQLLHVHEPRTMNSLAADSLLAHPRDGSQRRKPHGLARRLRRKTRQRGGQARAGPAVSPGCAVFAKAGFLCDNKRHPFRGINGRLAQRERRCLTSIGSGVQIPHRPPFERTVAAHLSSHFLFLHYLKLRYQFNFNAFARVAMHHNLHYKSHHAAHKHYFSSSVFSLSLPQAHTEGGKPCQMSN